MNAPVRAPGPVDALAQSALRGWPDACPPSTAALLFDQSVIAHLDRLSADAILAFQSEKANAVLRHARTASPLWAARLAAFSAARSWSELPLLGKEEYRTIAAAGPLSVPEGREPITADATSGSSAMPVQFHNCATSGRMAQAHGLYNWLRQGLDDRRTLAFITHKVTAHAGEHVSLPAHPIFWRGARLQRRARQFGIEAHARWLANADAAYLITVPSILRGMIDVYEAEGGAPRLAMILTYAESVEPDLRARALAVLGAEIRDSYGCAEIGPIAYQCPHSSERYHVAAANVLVEIVDDNGRVCPGGTLGFLIATGLNNHATPAIRYDLGDLAACRRGCACGYEGQVLERLLGRARFLLRLPSGERRHPGTFARSWLDIAPIREWRLVQFSASVVRVEVVLDRPLAPAERAGLAAMLEREISDELIYEVVQVDAIAWGPGFKRQDVVCMI